VIITPIEHKSVLGPCEALVQCGFRREVVPVDRDGRVDLGALANALDSDTLMVSIQLASNEIGTIQPLREVTELAHQVGAIVHADVTQGLGKIPVDLEELGVDLASMSAHKCYGPKGIGALYVRGGAGSRLVKPLCEGGGQERGLRPGTENVPAIVGFGAAAQIASERLESESRRVAKQRDELEEMLVKGLEGVRRNGPMSRRLPGLSSLTFNGVESDAVLANCPELAISTASACNSGAPEPSHVLLGIGLSRHEAYSTVRIGVGRFTTDDEIRRASEKLKAVVERLRSISRSESSIAGQGESVDTKVVALR